MNEFGQKGKVPLSERLAVSPEKGERTHRDWTDLHSRGGSACSALKAKKHGRRTIIPCRTI